MKKILLVAGARPNFMKIAPIIYEIELHDDLKAFLVHTGQHYDEKMSKVFFDELDIPKPDYNLGVGSGSHAVQTGKIMVELEPIVQKEAPDLVIVVGDVNSTLAGALVASKLHIPVAHVEAGLRSRNREMPEEINRVLTDQISDLLFTTSRDADENLVAEGIDKKKIHFVGNTMIDSLVQHLEKAERSTILDDLGLKPSRYGVLTLHRPANVDSRKNLEHIIDILATVQSRVPIVYPIHPRTRHSIEALGLMDEIEKLEDLTLIEPVGYLDFLALMSKARVVLTDSGGIQEETTYMGVPCLTMRTETERPITVNEGTNVIVGTNKDLIIDKIEDIMINGIRKRKIPELWDGRASKRIVAIIASYIKG